MPASEILAKYLLPLLSVPSQAMRVITFLYQFLSDMSDITVTGSRIVVRTGSP
jgi:hypothetical protein